MDLRTIVIDENYTSKIYYITAHFNIELITNGTNLAM